MHIHLVGVSGTGMGSLAGLLAELGHRVSGSDQRFEPPIGPLLQTWGVECKSGFSPDHLTPAPDLVVIGNVCRPDNVEAQAAIERGLEVTHLAGALRRFALQGRQVAVCAGTHGKTTTSSMVAWVLEQCGRQPGFFIGGVPTNFGHGFRAAAPDGPFVIEGDEYDTAFFEKTAKFLHYTPTHAILTSLEHDHIDIYPTEHSYVRAFEQFVALLPEHGFLVAHAGDPQVRQVVEQARSRLIWYAVEGFGRASVRVSPQTAPLWEARQLTTLNDGRQRFSVYRSGERIIDVELECCGKHNVANALGAFVLCRTAFACDDADITAALSTFSGTRCRQELLGEPAGVRVYSDFAHHPSAVAATLDGLRTRHPDGRLIAVFEPRSATACRSLHQAQYPAAFAAADRVLLAPLGRSGLTTEERLDTQAVAAELRRVGKSALACTSLSELVTDLLASAEPGDTVALLSNGAFGGIPAQLLAGFGERTLTEPNRGAV